MKIEKLEELQQNINALRSLNLEDCAALIGEVWRLRVAQTGKDLWHFPGNEVSYASPISYLSNGKQQVAIAIGDVLMAFELQ